MKLPPVSSQKKRRDQTTVTSIRCQGYWFQPIWRKQVIISKYESTQHRKGKLTKSQWSSAVSILTPAFHIWGTQQKDAIKLKKKKAKPILQQNSKEILLQLQERVTFLLNCSSLDLYIFLLSYIALFQDLYSCQ